MAYPTTTKQNSPPVYPLLTPVKWVDGKFDFFWWGLGLAEAGLWSVGIPPKPRWCHTICINVWWQVERARSYSGVWPAPPASLSP